MRKYIFLLVFFVFSSVALMAQEQFLMDLNVERLQIIQAGMIVLAAWALTNILLSGVMLTKSLSAHSAHFYRMNIFWNLVNLALAVAGLYKVLTTDASLLNLAETVAELDEITKILLFNAGLDVAYITGGFLMKEMAKTREVKRDLLHGYGRSLIMQGAFLLLFDLVLFAILQRLNSPLLDVFNKLSTHGESMACLWY